MYDTDLGELESHPINERYREFKVSKPMKNATHITYEVSGYFADLNKSVAVVGNKAPTENFVAQKRYSDFLCLREMQLERWPGFFIPAIPPKQTFVSLNYYNLLGQHGKRFHTREERPAGQLYSPGGEVRLPGQLL